LAATTIAYARLDVDILNETVQKLKKIKKIEARTEKTRHLATLYIFFV
jgi:hypothetical protein